MAIHHSTFYRWRKQAERYGLEMLRPRERRPPRMPNATSPFVEQRVVAFALGQPGFGPARIAAELARPKWGGIKLSPSGVWRVLRRHGLNTRRKRLSLVAGYAAPPEPAPREPEPERHLEAKRPGVLVQFDCFHVGRLSGTKGTVWQYTAIRRRLRLHLGRAARHPAQPLGEVDLAPRPPRRLGPRCPWLGDRDRDDGQWFRVPLP